MTGPLDLKFDLFRTAFAFMLDIDEWDYASS